jgi:hypothetical protein
MENNSIPKFIFRLSRFPVYRGSVLGRFYCIMESDYILRNGTIECNCVLRYIVIQTILILSYISL